MDRKTKFRLKTFFKGCPKSQKGSIALEYVLVSTFTILVGMTLMGVTSHILKEKIEVISESLDIDLGDISLNPFEE